MRFQSLGHDRGTAVTISLKYDPPAGKLGAGIASLLGQGLEQELDEDLQQFKHHMEVGGMPNAPGQPYGA